MNKQQVILRKAGKLRWIDMPFEHVQMAPLRENDKGGGAVFLKVAQGAAFPLHDHPGGEEVYVIYGRATIGDLVVEEGDYLWTAPGGIHGLEAEEETLLFISAPGGIKVLDQTSESEQ